MKIFNKVILVGLTIASCHSFAASGASQHAGASSQHSGLAVSHGVVAGAKVGSAVIATPLIIVGAVGSASTHVGSALMENAVGTQPLEITDKTITAGPSPQESMQINSTETRL